MRLVQYLENALRRRVALVEGEQLVPIEGFDSTYGLAFQAIDTQKPRRWLNGTCLATASPTPMI